MTQPEKSHTGFDTVDVDPEVLSSMMRQLSTSGMTIHSAEGRTVWAVTEQCKKNNIDHIVNIARDGNGEIQAVQVMQTGSSRVIDMQLPDKWTLEQVDSWVSLVNKKAQKISTKEPKIIEIGRSSEVAGTAVRDLSEKSLNYAVVMALSKMVWDESEIESNLSYVEAHLSSGFSDEPVAEIGTPVDFSVNWMISGPLIQENDIQLIATNYSDDRVWEASPAFGSDRNIQYGNTQLIAAMRCFVEMHLGPKVDIPNTLIDQPSKQNKMKL